MFGLFYCLALRNVPCLTYKRHMLLLGELFGRIPFI